MATAALLLVVSLLIAQAAPTAPASQDHLPRLAKLLSQVRAAAAQDEDAHRERVAELEAHLAAVAELRREVGVPPRRRQVR